MTDLTTLGDKLWRFTPTSEEHVAEPKAGYIQTGNVPHYGRPLSAFFVDGAKRPQLNVPSSLLVKEGKLIFPTPERHRTS